MPLVSILGKCYTYVLMVTAFAIGCKVDLDTDALENCIIETTQNAELCNSSSLCVTQGKSSVVYFKHLRKSGSL
jgi:hypothetical protein